MVNLNRSISFCTVISPGICFALPFPEPGGVRCPPEEVSQKRFAIHLGLPEGVFLWQKCANLNKICFTHRVKCVVTVNPTKDQGGLHIRRRLESAIGRTLVHEKPFEDTYIASQFSCLSALVSPSLSPLQCSISRHWHLPLASSAQLTNMGS